MTSRRARMRRSARYVKIRAENRYSSKPPRRRPTSEVGDQADELTGWIDDLRGHGFERFGR